MILSFIWFFWNDITVEFNYVEGNYHLMRLPWSENTVEIHNRGIILLWCNCTFEGYCRGLRLPWNKFSFLWYYYRCCLGGGVDSFTKEIIVVMLFYVIRESEI